MSRYVRLALKLLPIFGLLLFIGATFAFSKDQGQASRQTAVIDTSGPVVMSKCRPCHKDLSAFNNPNLVNFNHPVHFKRGIKCQACHVVFPHQPGSTIKPTMDLCANCHRLQHGNQGQMAPANCDLCHPKDFKLTPADHQGDFGAAGHRGAAETNIQRCLMCHQSSDCESCHAGRGLPPASAETYRWFGLWPMAETTGYKFTVGAKTISMGECDSCHRDLQQWKNDKLVNFNHPVHLKRQITCDNCHDRWPHSQDGIEKPKMDACVKCHRLEHGAQGRLVAAEKESMPLEYCYLCHPRSMNLKPDWHTEAFVGGAHKSSAKRDRGLCRGCHTQSFCDNCHQTEIPHAPGWKSEHGGTVAKQKPQGELGCFRCHKREGPRAEYQTAPSCAKCHKAVVYPHQSPWAPKHGKTAEEVGRDACFTCHGGEDFCRACHGQIKIPHDKQTWIGQHRLYLRTHPVEKCLNCHEAKQCEACHSVHKLHNQHTDYDFKGIR